MNIVKLIGFVALAIIKAIFFVLRFTALMILGLAIKADDKAGAALQSKQA